MTAEHGIKCWPSEHGAPARKAGWGRTGQERNRSAVPQPCPSPSFPDPLGPNWHHPPGLGFFLGRSFEGQWPLLSSTLSRPAQCSHPETRAVQLPPCSALRPLSDPANLALIYLCPPPQLSGRQHGIPPSIPAGPSSPSGGLPRLVVMASPVPSLTGTHHGRCHPRPPGPSS